MTRSSNQGPLFSLGSSGRGPTVYEMQANDAAPGTLAQLNVTEASTTEAPKNAAKHAAQSKPKKLRHKWDERIVFCEHVDVDSSDELENVDVIWWGKLHKVFIEKNKYTVDWWRHVNNHWELVKKEVSVEDRDIGNKIHAPTEWHDIPEHVMVFFNSPGLSP